MNHRKFCFAVILLLATGAVAARQEHQKMSQAAAIDQLMRQASQQAAINRRMTYGDRYNEQWEKGMISLPTARKSLAEEWQKLGLSPEQAKAVAGTFRGDTNAMLTHPPLKGRSEKEVAVLIQEALVSRHYRVANQLLIDYERLRLNLEPVSARARTE